MIEEVTNLIKFLATKSGMQLKFYRRSILQSQVAEDIIKSCIKYAILRHFLQDGSSVDEIIDLLCNYMYVLGKDCKKKL